MKSLLTLLLILSSALLASCVRLENAFPGVEIFRPVGMEIDGSSNKLYILSQTGIVYMLEKPSNETQVNTTNGGSLNQTDIFLNITDKVFGGDGPGDERGILGLAFHPNFPETPFVYVYYTGFPGNIFTFMTSYISRFNVTEEGVADPESEFVLLKVDQPFPNHNGGQMKFGPNDGFLYIAFGDGGNAGDPYDIGQDLGSLLGKILRIDVDSLQLRNDSLFAETARQVSSTTFRIYGVPEDNPFADGDALFVMPEIWAWGLRNPWRFSFDRQTGRMWNADAGQDKWEEINIIEKGGNYGWRLKEGIECFFPPSNCSELAREQNVTLIDPIHVYNHTDLDPGTLDSVIVGGYVYRGSQVPSLVGKYVFSDAVRGFIHALQFDEQNPANNTVEVIRGDDFPITSFGEDNNGELYALDYLGGRIFQFVED